MNVSIQSLRFAMKETVDADGRIERRTFAEVNGEVVRNELEVTEPPKPLRPARVVRCGNCETLGHNRRSCTAPGGGHAT